VILPPLVFPGTGHSLFRCGVSERRKKSLITTATGRPSVRVRGERKAIRRPRRLLRLDFKSRSVQAPGHKGVEHRAENSEEAKHSGKTNRL